MHVKLSTEDSGRAEHSCSSRGYTVWLKAATLSIAFIAFLSLISGGLFYESNDDVAMSMLCAGVGIVDSPNDHLFFTNHLIGRLLCFLYESRRSFPWYAGYLLACQALAYTVIFRILISKGKGAIGLAMVALCSIAILLRPVLQLQFTSTSYLLSTAGVLSILVGVERKSLHSYTILGFGLVILSVMVRDLSALMTVGLGLIFGLSRLLSSPGRKRAARFIIVMGVCGITCLGVRAIDRSYYNSGGWENATALNTERTFVEMHKMSLDEPKTREALASAGWSANDFRMFKNWGYLDRDIFSLERFRSIRRVLGPVSGEITLASLWQAHLKNLLDLTQLPIIVAAVILLLLSDRRRLSLVSGAVFFFCVFGVLSVLILILRVPPRVYASAFSFVAVLYMWYVSPRLLRTVPGPRLASSIKLVLVVLLLMTPTFFDYVRIIQDEGRRNLILKECYAELKRHPERVYVNWGTGMAVRFIRPFDDLESLVGGMKIISVGCRSLTPIFGDALARYGIRDLGRELDKTDLYICTRDAVCRVISQFILEHYRLNVSFSRVFTQSALPLSVYKAKFSLPERPKFSIADDKPAQVGKGDLDLLRSHAIDRSFVDLTRLSRDSDTYQFEASGARANLQFDFRKGIEPGRYRALQMFAAVDTTVSNRNLIIYFATADGAHSSSRIIRPWPDEKMHGYCIDFSQLGFPDSNRIGLIQILPFHPDSRFGGRIRLESVRLLEKSSGVP